MATADDVRHGDRRRLRALLRRLRREESGLGLVELLIAMTILSVAISAQLGVFGASMLSIGRASVKGTAVTVADIQMEAYRSLPYECIYLAAVSGDSTYAGDAAYNASQVTGSGCSPYATPPTNATTASRLVGGPDNRTYRVDTYIVSTTPSGGRAVKTVTVVVRIVASGVAGPVLARHATTFDQGNSPQS
ncbi:MAG: type II secretion system protein [Gaiellaceae bacterium]